MIILAIKSDKPKAELYLYENNKRVAEYKWQAHRELAETIHERIKKLLNKSSISLNELEGTVCFKGPGSFTGLRIGLSVANALAYAQAIPIVATKDDNWLEQGINKLLSGKDDRIALPEYESPAKTSSPRK